MRIDLTDAVFRSKPVIRLHPSDSVVVALRDIAAGEPLDAAELPGLCAAQAAGQGHKLAVAPLTSGDAVRKFGQVIGLAKNGDTMDSNPAPSLKLATNTPMYRRMQDDMDVNCGTIAELGAEIYRLILATASGQRTKSELFGYGEEEFAPWPLGATL